MKLLRNLIVVAAASGLLATSAAAQDSGVMIEGHGGIALPTFDIADVADLGPVFGGGIWYSPVGQRWAVGAEADFGFHSGADDQTDLTGLSEPIDVNVYHFMGKAGYVVYTSADGKFSLMLNAGAGVMMFDVDAADADTETYFAINAGAKLMYMVADRVNIVFSPQGDIAFSKEEDVFTDNSWVWPITAGLQLKL